MKKKKPIKEIWKPVVFDKKYVKSTRYEVSNWGRVRSFNKVSHGNILKGSRIEGYKILKLKLFKPETKENEGEINLLKSDISRLYTKRREFKRKKKPKFKIDRVTTSIKKREEKLRKLREKRLKKRTVNKAILFHQLVAKYFMPKPKPDETILAHLDYDKLNNSVENLKWMTREEHQKHIRKSPAVIAEKKERKYKQKYRTRTQGHKLNSTQVIHIKKLLNRGWTLRKIARKFGVSDMQIHRIKTGENWSHVKIPEEMEAKPEKPQQKEKVKNPFE